MKKILLSAAVLLSLTLTGCAYNGFSVKNENQKFALAIQRFEFLRHKGIPIVNTSSKTAGNGAPAAIKKPSAYHFQKPILAKFKEKLIKKKIIKVPVVARIHGSTSGLPVLTVDFVNKPLWKVLQDISSKTGYMFTSRRINLGVDITVKGRYNLAMLLNKLFPKDTVKIIPQTKKIQIIGEKR